MTAGAVSVAVSREGRLSDTFGRTEVQNLPLPQRDVFLLPRMSAGAAFIPGAANSTKLSSSPVITVNGNRYRGNNYVLDGAMNTNPNNTGEPAIVPALEAVEEVQVQTLNFAAEFGRGNGAVINVQTRSGTNELRGRVWEYFRSDALNARNHFSSITPPQTFNQFGTTLGGPILRNQTFFFGSYEGTRNEVERPYAFQVETPELRDYVLRTSPNSVAAELLRDFPAPSPDRGSDGRYLDQRDLVMPGGSIPAIGRANVLLSDNVRFDQYFGRVDHVLGSAHRLSARWIGEHQRDEGGTSSSAATLGRALRGSRGPFDGFFGNLNVGAQQILGRAVNDARVSFQIIDTTRGAADAIVPTINITGITAPFGDVFESTTRLRTLRAPRRPDARARPARDPRRRGSAPGDQGPGDRAADRGLVHVHDARELRRRSAVPPAAHRRSGQRRADRLPALFHAVRVGPVHPGPVDDQPAPEPQPRAAARLLRHRDRARTAGCRRSSSGQGDTFQEQIAGASIGRVDRLYEPEKPNFSPRIGLAWDPAGNGRMSIRSGFSLAYQPHHGQSISGARALPPDALDGVIQPANGIGTQILYDIPVPYNPEFGRGLNDSGGVQSRPGEPPIRITGFVVNPTIKTQYTESWFLNGQRRLGQHWVVELGYAGTQGVNLERIDDVNRFTGDLLDGREDRLNPNFSVLLFVTNGVSSQLSRVHVGAAPRVRRRLLAAGQLPLVALARHVVGHVHRPVPGQRRARQGRAGHRLPALRARAVAVRRAAPLRLVAGLSADRLRRPRRPRRPPAEALAGVGGGDRAVGPAVLGLERRGVLGRRRLQRRRRRRRGRRRLLRSAERAGGRRRSPSSFSQEDFLNGLFPASAFPKPAPGTNGTLGRNTFRGPRYATLDLSLTRTIGLGGVRQAQLRLDVYNALNTLNLFLPNADLSVSNFGKSTQAFDARVVQLGVKVQF